MIKSRNDAWVRCPECGHKLFRILRQGSGSPTQIEVKCHSCKAVRVIEIKPK